MRFRNPPEVTPSGYLPKTSGYRRIMGAMFAAGLATYMLLYGTQPLLPVFVEEFGVTATAATLTVTLTTTGLGVALLVAGPLSEYLGRAPLILGSVCSASIAGVLCAVAPSWEALLVLRCLQGVLLAGLPAVATVYLREEVHISAQASAVGLYIAGTGVGGLAGRVITAPVADLWGWRWGLAATGLVSLVCATVVAVQLPASRHFVSQRNGWRASLTTAGRASRDPALLALYGLGACGIGAIVGIFNTISFRLIEAPFELSLAMLSLVYFTHLLGSVSSTVCGVYADRLGRRALIPIGGVVGLVGLALMAIESLAMILIGLSMLVMGFFVIHSLSSGWVAARAHAAGISAGQAASFYLVSFYAGSSIFGSLGSSAWEHFDWHGVLVLAALLLAVCCVLAYALRQIPSLGPTSPKPVIHLTPP